MSLIAAAGHLIDVEHNDLPGTVGAYLIETDDGLGLFDCGPEVCLPKLEKGLAKLGVALGDIRHILLSHIHFDHAGAAGAIVRKQPHIQVHVSAIGAPHLIDPSRLEQSARRLYGSAFDAMWGELVPIPSTNLHTVTDSVVGLACFPTPGHAIHHVSYLSTTGVLYSGDAAGVRLAPGRYVLPPLPPPDVDLEAFEASIAEMERRAPTALALVHFGVFDDVAGHLARLRDAMWRWARWVEAGDDLPTFTERVHAELEAAEPELASRYLGVVPVDHPHAGLERYWRKRREAEVAATSPT